MVNPVVLTATQLQQKIRSLGDPVRALAATRFFKTSPGEYAAKDKFLGVRAPTLRQLAKEFRSLPLPEIKNLLHSEVHEDRSVALLILVLQVAKAPPVVQKQLFDFYLTNTQFINNWDLVDVSAPALVGAYLLDKSREPLYNLAKSLVLWERRIAIVATQHFIRHNDFADTLKIAKLLLADREDLIHKAVGWMLREIGKRQEEPLETFLKENHAAMPRTMLRYAIERFPEERRQLYLKGGTNLNDAKKSQ